LSKLKSSVATTWNKWLSPSLSHARSMVSKHQICAETKLDYLQVVVVDENSHLSATFG
jgi:hypothetical protein